MKKTIRIFLFGLSALMSAQIRAGAMAVNDAWIQEAPPTSHTLACYLDISNASSAPVLLEKITSADFSSVQIHTTRVEDSRVRMDRQHKLNIDAGASVTLRPGSHHLMLIDRKRPLRAGDKVTLKFYFSNGEVLDVSAPVRRQDNR